jgi:hypothetical protein
MAEMVKDTNANVKKFGMSWKNIGWGIGRVFNIVLLLVMIASLMPGLYFSWRVNQPMELPEFGGKTFYQVLVDRQQTYAEHEELWRRTHRGEYPLGSKNICFLLETFVVFVQKPSMEIVLVLHLRSPDDPYYALPEGVNFDGIANFLPASWTLFEMSTLGLYQHIPHGISAARGPNHGSCVISPPNGMSGGK